MNKLLICNILIGSIMSWSACTQQSHKTKPQRAPNILFAIADDQSYPYTSIYGMPQFVTPAFDSVARHGVLFNNAFVAAPQCSPSRAAILTGRNIWQLEEAGTHSSYFPKKFPVFTDALASAGYFTGYTGKAWGPGNWRDAGWQQNPVGPEYNSEKYTGVPTSGINRTNYAANFERFLAERPEGKPFFFWFGCHEPHRVYEYGSGLRQGLDSVGMRVPPFLPSHDTVRTDLLDYAFEVSWFDRHLKEMLDLLERIGELENTIIVVTADNGMAFPHAKAGLHEYGIHVPLAICGPGIRGPRTIDVPVGLIDLAPTILGWADAAPLPATAGESLVPLLNDGVSDTSRRYVLSGRERHTHARPDNLGYPARAIRTTDYLYICNLKPDRWPMGDPPPVIPVDVASGTGMKPIVWGFEDIDDSPTKELLLTNRYRWPEQFGLATAKRGAEELYAIREDPACLTNLASDSRYADVLAGLRTELWRVLAEQGDPRVVSGGEVFDSYPRFGRMRPFPGFREQGVYNPAYQDKE
ncbi:sulfatase family protein [Parapedobacter soli]|uniref:sulfatase family protein n=1 Tax=Parapedobacter soli TaxID=416955 RepID=UPI0021C6A3D3|nr:sulfatase [Parapedobacter soli]